MAFVGARDRATKQNDEEHMGACWADGRPNELSALEWFETEVEQDMRHRVRIMESGKVLLKTTGSRCSRTRSARHKTNYGASEILQGDKDHGQGLWDGHR